MRSADCSCPGSGRVQVAVLDGEDRAEVASGVALFEDERPAVGRERTADLVGQPGEVLAAGGVPAEQLGQFLGPETEQRTPDVVGDRGGPHQRCVGVELRLDRGPAPAVGPAEEPEDGSGSSVPTPPAHTEQFGS